MSALQCSGSRRSRRRCYRCVAEPAFQRCVKRETRSKDHTQALTRFSATAALDPRELCFRRLPHDGDNDTRDQQHAYERSAHRHRQERETGAVVAAGIADR